MDNTSYAHSLKSLNTLSKNSMLEYLGIKFTDIDDNCIHASMPVSNKTMHPFKGLHGGASVALAESVGGAGSFILIDNEKYFAYGAEINANHLKTVTNGFVHAKATLIHYGKSTHVWDIQIHDDEENLICISRLTNIITLKSI